MREPVAKKVSEMKSARVENKVSYIKIYNGKKEVFLDADGQKISEDSDIVQKEQQKEMPSKIGEYQKIQYSLDDAYYKNQQQ